MTVKFKKLTYNFMYFDIRKIVNIYLDLNIQCII